MIMTKEPDVMEALAKALAPYFGQKTATGTPTTYYAHGPGGLFSTAGVNQDVLATVVTPTGLLEVLPAYGTRFMSPMFQYITGFLDDTGADPDTECEDCKTAGVKKGCIQTAQFGRYCRETKEMSVERIAQLNNRAEPTDLRLINPLFDGNTFTPAMTNQNPFRGEVQQALLELGVSIERLLSPQLWTGNPANNNVGGGYAEFPGLDILVGTTKVDAISGVACPSLASDLKDFNYQEVCAQTPQNVVEVLSYLYRYLAHNARTMNCDPVDFRMVMREELFYELTSCWPCSYLSFRCGVVATALIDPVPTVDAAEAIRMRDDMRNGRYLLVDGKRIPVVLDDGIVEDNDGTNANLNAGQFSSDIYILPFSVRGNFASLYLEYFDFGAGQEQINLANMQDIYTVTDGGKFLWTRSWVEGCFLLKTVIRPRVVLLTPHLAGRLQNVMYEPLQHTRQPFPSDGYFIDGGETTRDAPSLYSDWHTR